MILYPAIDIRGGHAVRLVQGDYERETVYDADPVDAARRWVEQGARALHVVDLDGARAGEPGEPRARRADLRGVRGPGAGRRRACATRAAVAAVLAAGAARAVLGTAALARPGAGRGLAAEHGERIVVARRRPLRARSRSRAGSSETRDRGRGPDRASWPAAACAGSSTRRSRWTGRSAGPRSSGLRAVAAAAAESGAELIYSGGVGSLDTCATLAALEPRRLAGVIVGRALYEGRFTVAEGQAALDGVADADGRR